VFLPKKTAKSKVTAAKLNERVSELHELIREADRKAGVLTGAVLGGLGFVGAKVGTGPLEPRIPLGLAALALVVALVWLLLTVYPRGANIRLGTAGDTDEASGASDDVARLRKQVDELTRIACAKFRCLRVTIACMTAAIILTGVSIVLSVVI